MKSFKEASFKVDVAGLPPIFMDAKSSVEIRKNLRRQLKFPDDIQNIERITKGEKIKSFKDRLKTTLTGKGQDVKEMNKPSSDHMAKLDKIPVSQMTPAQKKANAERRKEYVAFQKSRRVTPFVPHPNKVKEDYSKGLDGKKLKASKSNKPLIAPYEEDKASEDMLMSPKRMAKKTKFLKPQDTDKLKTDLSRLKKALGPNHPMNKSKEEACWSGYKQVGMKKKGNRQVPNCVPEAKVHELIQFAPAAMAVGAAAVRAAPAAGAALHSVQKFAKKTYKKFTGKEETDLEEKKKKLTRAQRNKKARSKDRARDANIRRGNPFNVQT